MGQSISELDASLADIESFLSNKENQGVKKAYSYQEVKSELAFYDLENGMKLDFSPTAEGTSLRKRTDEIGIMARKIHDMRKILHEMIVNIHQVEDTIIGSVDNLNLIMQENSSRSEDNSAATQEIAAGMQVASSNTASIVESIDEVKRNSQSIYELAQNGEKKF